jgi:hypothetical protein
MSWGASALVLEPESLRDEIREEAEVILERYVKNIKEEEKFDFKSSEKAEF